MIAFSKCGYIVLVLLSATLCSCAPSKSVPDAKLDEIEARMRSEAGYMFQVLQGDRQEAVSLVLAGLKRKPGNSVWYGLIQGCFAADRFDAKGVSPGGTHTTSAPWAICGKRNGSCGPHRRPPRTGRPSNSD